jgi:HEAT repeat protein
MGHVRRLPSSARVLVPTAIIAAALTLVFLGASAARADAPIKVEWNKGLLSVSAENAELSQVLREVARQTGIRIRGSQDVGQRVSIHLSEVSLEKGLKALLDGVGYAVLGDISSPEKARSAQVVVFAWLAAPDSNRAASSNAATNSPQKIKAAIMARMRAGSVDEASRQDKALAAVEAAAAKGDLEALSKAVQSSDPAVQSQAFEELSKLNPQAALDALSNALRSDEPAQRLQALQLLDQSDQADNDTIVSAMGQALNADDPSIKDYAIQALARRGGSQEMDLLRQAMGDPDPAVRLMVLESVGQETEALPLLQQAVNDSDPSVSAAANQLLKAANEASQPAK